MPTKRFRIGFRTAGFKDRGILDTLATIRRCGYDGVELGLEHPDLAGTSCRTGLLQEIGNYLATSGLELACVSYHGKRDALPEKRGRTLRALDVCVALACPLLVISSVTRRGGAGSVEFGDFARWLADLCGASAQRGVVLAVEPEPDTVIHGRDDLCRLLDAVPFDCLKVNLDIGHAFITDRDLCDTIRTLAPRIVQFHVEDIAGTVHEHLVPGEGDIDFHDVLRTLEQLDFRGYLVIDLFKITQDPDPVCLSAFRRLEALIRSHGEVL